LYFYKINNVLGERYLTINSIGVPGSYGVSGQHQKISNSRGDKLWFKCENSWGYVEIRAICFLDVRGTGRAFRYTCVINEGSF